MDNILLKKSDKMSEDQEQFRKLLKENGLKITTQRLMILQVLKSRSGLHLTAEEIYDCVRRQYPEIGLATVYRNIQLLCELHMIDKLNLDDGIVRYEIGEQQRAKQEHHHHHHMICLRCGAVLSVEDDLLEALEERIKDTLEFQVVDHEVKLLGYCKDCCNKVREI